MKTLAVVSTKGGCFKSGLSINLAVAATSDKKATVLLDTDPQASASGWSDIRSETEPVVVSIQASRLKQALEQASKAADLAIIDTAPQNSASSIAAAEFADLVLVPCRAGILDLHALTLTERLLTIAGTKAFVVLVAVPTRASKMVAELKEIVQVRGLEVAPVVIHQRAAYSHSLFAGHGVLEHDPCCAASDEIRELYKFVKKRMTF